MALCDEPAKLNVLIADDDPVFRSLAAARLHHFDCNIHEAADGGEAWKATRSLPLGLAIVDFNMPGLDGIALTRCLRAHPATQHIPIIMCTASTDASAMRLALEAGVSSFINKPVNWSLFEPHIRHLLEISDSSIVSGALIRAHEKAHEEKDAIVARLIAAVQSLAGHALTNTDRASLSAEAAELAGAYRRTTIELKSSTTGDALEACFSQRTA